MYCIGGGVAQALGPIGQEGPTLSHKFVGTCLWQRRQWCQCGFLNWQWKSGLRGIFRLWWRVFTYRFLAYPKHILMYLVSQDSCSGYVLCGLLPQAMEGLRKQRAPTGTIVGVVIALECPLLDPAGVGSVLMTRNLVDRDQVAMHGPCKREEKGP